jgi:endoglucanase Acf2
MELNDHHFHYGYFIKAASIIGIFDIAWLNQYQEIIELLIRDASNWDMSDRRFPL